MEKYEHILPGSAERILSMAESQSKHRHTQESKFLDSSLINTRIGMIFGFIISMTTIISGVFLIFFDKSTEGLSTILGSLVALVGIFIYSKKKDSAEN